MPPFVPLLEGVQAEIVYVLFGEIVENRLWFTPVFEHPGFDEVQGVADGLLDWHTTYVLPYLSQDILLADIEVKTWYSDPPEHVAIAPANLSGGSSERAHSANVAVRVPFRWAVNVKERQNSNFVPGIPIDMINGNQIEPTFRTAMFEAYAALIDAARTWYPDNYWYWVVTSQVADNTYRDEQRFTECIGPRPEFITLAPRRRRLPKPPPP